MRPKDFISISDFDRDFLDDLITTAAKYKSGKFDNKPLKNKDIALLFFNPSLRTRISFELAIKQLGGSPSTIGVGGQTWNLEWRSGIPMDSDRAEHVIDAVRVLERYYQALCIRAFPELQDIKVDASEPILSAFAKHSKNPIINMESCISHPCQALADIMTIREVAGKTNKVKVALFWTYHPRRLPLAVTLSFLSAAVKFGCDLTVCAPEEYFIPSEICSETKKVKFVSNPSDLDKDTQIIYAKSWSSPKLYSQADQDLSGRQRYKDRIVNSNLLKIAQQAKIMHCMPFRRNVEITDEVADSDSNLMYQQAENRLYVQKAVLNKFVS